VKGVSKEIYNKGLVEKKRFYVTKEDEDELSYYLVESFAEAA